jgi:uncharacterized protein
MQAIGQLAELNEVDLVVDGLKARLAEIAEALKEPAAVRAARTEVSQAEAELTRLRVRQQECELLQTAAANKLAGEEQRLYSGKVQFSKELEDLEAKIRQSRRQKSEAEDTLLETLLEVEATEARLATGREQLAALAAQMDASRASLREESALLTRRLATVQARQAAARAAAPAHLLPTYDALRVRRGGRAVATIDGDVCSACKVAVSPTLRAAVRDGDEPVYCENCGRILWAE